jgi:cell pole-organizing protein PopZ
MENSAAATEDQSMEEILQSIRRIIAEEGEDATQTQANGSDVLELTDMVTEEGSVISLENPAAPPAEVVEEQPASIAEAVEAEMPPAEEEDVLKNIDAMLGSPAASPVEEAIAEPKDALQEIDSLLSNEAATAAANAFRNLKRPQAEVLPAIDSLAFRSGTTVEDLMMESLRPMLKSWLDNNLPAIVERIVEREVRKLAQ